MVRRSHETVGREERRMAEIVTMGRARAREVLADRRGQGTTEYAILVGVLVVAAMGLRLLRIIWVYM